MKTWKKVLIGGLSALTLAGGANIAAMASGQRGASTVEDVKGPCDEAEHANDPRCASPEAREDHGPRREAGDHRGRDLEARGGDDEGEEEAEDEAEDEAEEEDDRSGPSERSGPSDRSGHDDGEDHDRGDDHGGDN